MGEKDRNRDRHRVGPGEKVSVNTRNERRQWPWAARKGVDVTYISSGESSLLGGQWVVLEGEVRVALPGGGDSAGMERKHVPRGMQ